MFCEPKWSTVGKGKPSSWISMHRNEELGGTIVWKIKSTAATAFGKLNQIIKTLSKSGKRGWWRLKPFDEDQKDSLRVKGLIGSGQKMFSAKVWLSFKKK